MGRRGDTEGERAAIPGLRPVVATGPRWREGGGAGVVDEKMQKVKDGVDGPGPQHPPVGVDALLDTNHVKQEDPSGTYELALVVIGPSIGPFRRNACPSRRAPI
jgi:hypothetical protein